MLLFPTKPYMNDDDDDDFLIFQKKKKRKTIQFSKMMVNITLVFFLHLNMFSSSILDVIDPEHKLNEYLFFNLP